MTGRLFGKILKDDEGNEYEVSCEHVFGEFGPKTDCYFVTKKDKRSEAAKWLDENYPHSPLFLGHEVPNCYRDRYQGQDFARLAASRAIDKVIQVAKEKAVNSYGDTLLKQELIKWAGVK